MRVTFRFHHIAPVLAFAAASVIAADLPKEGSYDMVACLSGVSKTIVFSPTHSAMTLEQSGATLSNPPGGFLDRGTFTCLGMGTSLGQKMTYDLVCEVVVPDGGKMLSTFSLGRDGKITREMVAGTGRYEGIVASGIAEAMGTFPSIRPGTFQSCNHQTGTYKLK